MQTYRKDDPNSIQKMFSSIADQYDTGNAVLSLQLYRLWNRRLINRVLLPGQPKEILDLCCGTGEISFAYLNKLHRMKRPLESCQIHLIDFSEGMLRVAQQRAEKQADQAQLRFVLGDAQAIPLPNASMDAVVMAYGIRNVTSPRRCLEEVYRVLRPGGRLGILELTRPNNPLLRFGHALYLRLLVPVLGRLVTSNAKAYQYLQQSIQGFVSVDEMQKLMMDVGFHECNSEAQLGGVATLFTCLKPAVLDRKTI